MTDAQPDILAIFTQAVACAGPQEREEYVADACGNDSVVRQRVDTLLRAHFDAGNFLGGDAQDSGTNCDRPITEQPGDTIGPYKLLQQIGEGGMGVVYMAEQTEPVERRVALKVIKPGMDTRKVIARFEAERQALAMMDHPNVAKVHDAGTTDTGRRYFVMELVKGVSITQYCDQHQLSPRERLELFVQVCQAVQHAHQKGIIHRDIKPSNVLVAQYDNKPVPKIIDFGVAKAIEQRLTEKTVFTEFGQVVGTVEYMSPEQAQLNQLDIDTRTDIYSLGVLLYELLTGDTPFDKERLRSAAFDEMLRIIREEEPPRPSMRLSTSASLPSVAANRHVEPQKLSTLVRGELDWLVMKAMEKDRNRRYETASKFAEDVEHYLKDEAVVACPPSVGYRFRKFARRNKAVIATSAAIAVALFLGIAGTTWQAIRATHERDRALTAESKAAEEAGRADMEAAIAKAVNDFLQNDLLGMASADSQAEAELSPDPNITLRTLLDRAAERIENRFSEQPLVEAAIRHAIGTAYASIGDYRKAEAHHQRAIELRRESAGAEAPDTLSSMNDLASAYWRQGRYGEAEKLYQKALEIQLRVLGQEDPQTLRTMNSLAIVYDDQARDEEAEELYAKSLEIQRRVLGEEHPDTLKSVSNLASLYSWLGRLEEAESLNMETLEIQRRVLGEEHPGTLASMHNLGAVYLRQGRYAEAESLFELGLEFQRRTLGEKHPQTLLSMHSLAIVYIELGRYQKAETLHSETLEIRRHTLGAEHPHTLASMSGLAGLYSDQGRYDEAEALHRQTLEARRHTLGEEHDRTLASMNNLALVFSRRGDYDEAEKLYRQTLELQERLLGNSHPDTRLTKDNLGLMYTNQSWRAATSPNLSDRDPVVALRAARNAFELRPEDANAWDNLGTALYRNERWEEAIEALEKAREMRGGKDYVHQFFLVMAYWQNGQQAKAVANYVEAAQWMLTGNRGNQQRRFQTEAEELLSPDQIEKFCTTRLAGDAKDAGWHYVARGLARTRLGQIDEAASDFQASLDFVVEPEQVESRLLRNLSGQDELLRRLAELRPASRKAFIDAGRWFAKRGDWRTAIPYYQAGVEPLAANGRAYEFACLLLMLKRDNEYERVCGGLVKLAEERPDAIGEGLVMTLTLRDGNGPAPERLVQWAESIRDEGDALALYALGCAYYRAARYADAVESLAAYDAAEEKPASNAAFPLALAYHRLGQSDESRRWYETGRQNLEAMQNASQRPWGADDFLTLNVWRAEAQASIDLRDPERASQEKTPRKSKAAP